MFTILPDKNTGDAFTQAMWATYLEANLNFGVTRPIADAVLASSAAAIDFTSISQNFAHLLLALYTRSDTAAAGVALSFQYNGDSGANYDDETLALSGSTASGQEAFGGTGHALPGSPGSTAGANLYGGYLIFIPHYTAANNKNAISIGGFKQGTSTGNMFGQFRNHFYRSNTAISRIRIQGSGNLVAGSRATLYGFGAV